MNENDEVDRLKRRLSWESAGPLAQLSKLATDAVTAKCEELAGWVRDMAEDRPLISLWIAFQIGFAAGRWGPRVLSR
jgi:hypothetical protein